MLDGLSGTGMCVITSKNKLYLLSIFSGPEDLGSTDPRTWEPGTQEPKLACTVHVRMCVSNHLIEAGPVEWALESLFITIPSSTV